MLKDYFLLDYEYTAKLPFAKGRVLKIWYGNLSNEFSLQNFLMVCGSNVPSKDAFLADAGNKLENLVKNYIGLLKKHVNYYGGYDKNLRMYPKKILFQNIIKNHYGISADEVKTSKKEASALKEKEEAEKGGFLRNNIYYKINSRGLFDYYYFWNNLGGERKINQSKYRVEYKKESSYLYTITLKDRKTGIQLPAFKAQLSRDKTKLYIGEDKVPYILENFDESNCLYDKKTVWSSTDGKESFSTASVHTVWKSSITGGIEVKGMIYKISNNKYAFVIYKNSWGGKIENNLVIITTANNCNTIYYGKGKKKMVNVK
tara:strand:- start:296 stop:1243 length:948 start_codon:yes stop_codon:yes gene_type:complete